MEITSLKLAYFSPTGTTISIVQAIARGINQDTAEQIDVTRANVREKQQRTSGSDLPVVYGNRDYEDALLELKDVVKEAGGLPTVASPNQIDDVSVGEFTDERVQE